MADRIEAKYVQVNSYNIPNSRMLVEGVIKLAGTPLGSFGNSIEPKRPFGALGWNKNAQFQVKVCAYYESDPVGPTGGIWDQIRLLGLSEDLRGLPKGLFWTFWVPQECGRGLLRGQST